MLIFHHNLIHCHSSMARVHTNTKFTYKHAFIQPHMVHTYIHIVCVHCFFLGSSFHLTICRLAQCNFSFLTWLRVHWSRVACVACCHNINCRYCTIHMDICMYCIVSVHISVCVHMCDWHSLLLSFPSPTRLHYILFIFESNYFLCNKLQHTSTWMGSMKKKIVFHT